MTDVKKINKTKANWCQTLMYTGCIRVGWTVSHTLSFYQITGDMTRQTVGCPEFIGFIKKQNKIISILFAEFLQRRCNSINAAVK